MFNLLNERKTIMKTIREKIEIMQAYERGEQIQVQRKYTNEWKDINSPVFNWVECDYQVKPKTLESLTESKFKDGDILFIESFCSWIAIYKENEDREFIYKYVAISPDTPDFLIFTNNYSPICYKESISEIRFATDDEKQKLFDVIKKQGYQWDAENKSLNKIVNPKFKEGDRIRDKLTGKVYKISYVLINGCGGGRYGVYGVYGFEKPFGTIIDFKEQDNYELFPNKFIITTLKPFDKVLVRNENDQKWTCDIFSYYDDKDPKYPFWGVGRSNSKQCIPYERNEHLLGTTDDCDDFYKTWK